MVRSVGKAQADDAPENVQPLFPSRWHLVNPPIPLCDFDSDFGLEEEAVGIQLDALQDVAPETRRRAAPLPWFCGWKKCGGGEDRWVRIPSAPPTNLLVSSPIRSI